MIIICQNWFKNTNFIGIAIFPFIILRDEGFREDRKVLNHEKFHLRQQIELLIIPFYIWYIVEFMLRYVQYKNRHKAYLNISFEREAYAHETDGDYLKRRRLYSFLKYIKDK